MCGRFTLKTPVLEWLASLFAQERPRLESLARALTQSNPLLAAPRYNISPTQPLWVVTHGPHDAPLTIDGLAIQSMRWGLIPAWVDSTKVAYSMINARSETLFEKPSFKNLIHSHRCAIVADGYYEWQKPLNESSDQSMKQPFWIHRPEEKPFAMAGLWTENRKVQPNSVLSSATIITTGANADTSRIHDRMPVLLTDSNAMRAWLEEKTPIEELLPMLAPARDGSLVARAVSTQVNSPRRDGPQLIEPIAGS